MDNQDMTDAELAVKVNAFLSIHQYSTRSKIRITLRTSLMRLNRLQELGLIKLPRTLTRSQGGTLGRKQNGTMDNWYINSPAAWQQKAKAS